MNAWDILFWFLIFIKNVAQTFYFDIKTKRMFFRQTCWVVAVGFVMTSGSLVEFSEMQVETVSFEPT